VGDVRLIRRSLLTLIGKRAPAAKRVVETGPLSVWFYHVLCAEGLPAICIDARHAKAALDMAANKTDANDADGLAELAEVVFFRAVRVKGFDSMLARDARDGAHKAGQGDDRILKSDPRHHEDIRSGRPCREGKQVRKERPLTPCRSARACSYRAPDIGGLARPADSRC
jgi:hypothetical protein